MYRLEKTLFINHNILNTLHLLVGFFFLPLTIFASSTYQVTTIPNFASFITYFYVLYKISYMYVYFKTLSLKYGPQTYSINVSWELIRIQTLSPTSYLLNQNLHFNKIPCKFMCIIV